MAEGQEGVTLKEFLAITQDYMMEKGEKELPLIAKVEQRMKELQA